MTKLNLGFDKFLDGQSVGCFHLQVNVFDEFIYKYLTILFCLLCFLLCSM